MQQVGLSVLVISYMDCLNPLYFFSSLHLYLPLTVFAVIWYLKWEKYKLGAEQISKAFKFVTLPEHESQG